LGGERDTKTFYPAAINVEVFVSGKIEKCKEKTQEGETMLCEHRVEGTEKTILRTFATGKKWLKS